MPEPSIELLDNLGAPGQRAKLDPHDMLGLVLKFPQQCREAAAIAWQYGPGRTTHQPIRQIVITALGGSAIGGDFVRCIMDENGTVPLIVNRDYTLPHWVGPSTLVLAGSYSGNTEETLSAYAAALRANAQIAVVTSGGKMREQALADGHSVATVPGGQPPRSATGYMFFPMLSYLSQLNLLHHDFRDDLEETFSKLERMAATFGPEMPIADNAAKQLAIKLYAKIPVVYGSQGYRGAVAYRWKSQFNENTKIVSLANVLPEQNHNEILAWVLAQRQAQTWAAIFLRDPLEVKENPRIARRVEVTKDLVDRAAEVHEVYAEGASLLARMFTLIYIADFVSVYLAYLYEICPTDIGSIDHLKAELSKI